MRLVRRAAARLEWLCSTFSPSGKVGRLGRSRWRAVRLGRRWWRAAAARAPRQSDHNKEQACKALGAMGGWCLDWHREARQPANCALRKRRRRARIVGAQQGGRIGSRRPRAARAVLRGAGGLAAPLQTAKLPSDATWVAAGFANGALSVWNAQAPSKFSPEASETELKSVRGGAGDAAGRLVALLAGRVQQPLSLLVGSEGGACERWSLGGALSGGNRRAAGDAAR